MATIRKRNNRYHVQIRRKGFPTVTQSFEKRANAEAWARQYETDLERGEIRDVRNELKGITLKDLLTRYRDTKSVKKRGRRSEFTRIATVLKDPIASLSLSEITTATISAYRDRRLQTVVNATVRREFTMLQHAFEIARLEWDLPLYRNPVRDLRKPKDSRPRERRVRSEELKALLAASSRLRRPIAPIILFAIATGMRRGEIVALRWTDINHEKRLAHVHDSKTGEPRQVPLSPEACDVLQSVKRRLCHPMGHLGHMQTGESCQSIFGMSSNALNLAWQRLTKRAGVVDLHFHDLRHEAISRFFEMGLSVPEVALISGHKDVRMLFRYTHLKPEALSEKLARLGAISEKLVSSSNPLAA
jgi:integrase